MLQELRSSHPAHHHLVVFLINLALTLSVELVLIRSSQGVLRTWNNPDDYGIPLVPVPVI